MSSIIDQLSSPTTVLTCGITTILLLGTTLYYINNKSDKITEGNNNNNKHDASSNGQSKAKELDRTVSCFVFLNLSLLSFSHVCVTFYNFSHFLYSRPPSTFHHTYNL